MKTQDQRVPSEKWKSKELKPLRFLVKEGGDAKHISRVFLRTVKEVREKIKRIKVVTKKGKKVEVSEEVQEAITPPTTREKAKEMARAARKIARANNKRITMAMFFVENLED